jgi:outer membrane protein TolC
MPDNMKKLIFIFILNCLIVAHLCAADTLFIALREATLIAMERNPSISIERLNPEIAKTYLRAEGATFDPELQLSGSMTETAIPSSASGDDPTTSQKVQYQGALGWKLPTGSTIQASASISGDLNDPSADQYTSKVGLSVTQSLLRGVWLGPNLARLRKAKIDVEISELELKAMGESVVASVEQAYWNLYLAQKEFEIQEQSLELAQSHLDETEERIRVGKIAEIELIAVQAEVALREESMIDARNRCEQARLRFLYLLNPDESGLWDIIPVPTDQPSIAEDTIDGIELHEELAMKFRPDLLQARLNLDKNALDITRTRNGLLPRLDLFIELGRTSYSESFKESTLDLESPYYSMSGGAVFEFPVTLRNARAEHARSKFTREQINIAVDNMERLVQRDIRTAYAEITRARQQIEASLIASELQKRRLEAEEEKFRVGKSTNFMVLQAQRDFIASQLSHARAKVAYNEALVNLYVMEGTLLARRGIE